MKPVRNFGNELLIPTRQSANPLSDPTTTDPTLHSRPFAQGKCPFTLLISNTVVVGRTLFSQTLLSWVLILSQAAQKAQRLGFSNTSFGWNTSAFHLS